MINWEKEITGDHKIRIQRIIFIGGILLFIVKIFSFYITNSVGILSDALESTINIITGFITLKALQYAMKPRDYNHPYGHGKVELISASVEGILIVLAGCIIIFEAIKRLGNPPQVLRLDMGLLLLLFTAIANYLMGIYSVRMGKKHGSIGLEAGGQHLISDTYTTLALIGGLFIFYVTSLQWIDSLLGIFFGSFIIYTGFQVLRKTINGLMDEADMGALESLSKLLTNQRSKNWINIHKLTYLKFGNTAHVDMHLTLPWYFDVRQATHEITSLKQIIRKELPEKDIDISIQSEPCVEGSCQHCNLACQHRLHDFKEALDWNTKQITGKNIYNYSKTDSDA
jgi:cation diffusion facilitator family transporter